MNAPICLHAGPKALAHIKAHGLRAQDIAAIPAAAGGPRGLILQAMDQWLFGEWLPGAPLMSCAIRNVSRFGPNGRALVREPILRRHG